MLAFGLSMLARHAVGRCRRRPLPQAHVLLIAVVCSGLVDAGRHRRGDRRHRVLDAAPRRARSRPPPSPLPPGADLLHRRGREPAQIGNAVVLSQTVPGGDSRDRPGARRRADRPLGVRRRRCLPARRMHQHDRRAGAARAARRSPAPCRAVTARRDARRRSLRPCPPQPRVGRPDDDRRLLVVARRPGRGSCCVARAPSQGRQPPAAAFDCNLRSPPDRNPKPASAGLAPAQAVRSRISCTSHIGVCGCRNAKRPTVSPSHLVGGMKATPSSCRARAHAS